MVKMEQKSVFLQALVVSVFIFIIGFLIGIYFEDIRIEKMKDIFFNSETNINDFEISSRIIFQSNASCEKIKEKSIFFADKVYAEASKLEKYDNSNKLTERFMPLHKRYDLLRVILWRDLIENKKLCENKINTAVYLYTYINPSLNTQGVQGAMSNFLGDLKNEYGDDLTLIPIAVDTEVDSLDSMREIYNLSRIPVIFINEKYKFEDLDSLKNLRNTLEKER
jgi:hypothetical protein